jgi:hypothetical protein
LPVEQRLQSSAPVEVRHLGHLSDELGRQGVPRRTIGAHPLRKVVLVAEIVDTT